jgi:hypothetical protein
MPMPCAWLVDAIPNCVRVRVCVCVCVRRVFTRTYVEFLQSAHWRGHLHSARSQYDHKSDKSTSYPSMLPMLGEFQYAMMYQMLCGDRRCIQVFCRRGSDSLSMTQVFGNIYKPGMWNRSNGTCSVLSRVGVSSTIVGSAADR